MACEIHLLEVSWWDTPTSVDVGPEKGESRTPLVGKVELCTPTGSTDFHLCTVQGRLRQEGCCDLRT